MEEKLKNPTRTILSFCIFITISCFAFVKNITARQPVITIWVHGTHFVSNQTLKKVHSLVNKVIGTFLNKEIPSFHIKDGLHPISSYEKGSYILSKAEQLDKQNKQFSFEHFYTFGWSGKLSNRSREKHGIALYNDLQNLLKSYRKKSKQPFIRIITHSHGGNVVLQLAKAEKLFRHNLIIDELIMLACPVQKTSQKLIAQSVFKQVYSLYSPKDMIQVMDPQKLYSFTFDVPLFSQRVFEPISKIKQACITMNGKHLLLPHTMFLTNSFTNHLPYVLNQMETWQPGTIGKVDIST